MEPWEEIPAGLLTGLQSRSLEQDDLTYEYLEAGTRLIASTLLEPRLQEGDHPFLRWLSRSSVIKEVGNGKLNGGDGSFRYRWPTHADYVRDLVAYFKWRRLESVLPLREPSRIKDALKSSKPSAAITSVAQMNLEGLFNNVFFPLQLVALAVVGSSPRDPEASHDFYEEAAAQWTGIIEAFLERYQLTLRADVDIDDLVQILMSIGDGLALRELADPTKGPERTKRLALQGTAATALLLAAVDGNDSRSLAERTDDLVGDRAQEPN